MPSAWFKYLETKGWLKLTPAQLIAVCARAEASIDGEEGMQAVINVIQNRRVHPLKYFILDNSTAEEIYRETNSPYHAIILDYKQFSAFLPGYDNITRYYNSPEEFENYLRINQALQTAWGLVQRLMAGTLPDITGGADHYVRFDLTTTIQSWLNSGMVYRTRIKSHVFFSAPPHFSQNPQSYIPAAGEVAPETRGVIAGISSLFLAGAGA